METGAVGQSISNMLGLFRRAANFCGDVRRVSCFAQQWLGAPRHAAAAVVRAYDQHATSIQKVSFIFPEVSKMQLTVELQIASTATLEDVQRAIHKNFWETWNAYFPDRQVMPHGALSQVEIFACQGDRPSSSKLVENTEELHRLIGSGVPLSIIFRTTQQMQQRHAADAQAWIVAGHAILPVHVAAPQVVSGDTGMQRQNQ